MQHPNRLTPLSALVVRWLQIRQLSQPHIVKTANDRESNLWPPSHLHATTENMFRGSLARLPSFKTLLLSLTDQE